MPLPPSRTRRLSLASGMIIGVIGTILGFAALILPKHTDNSLLQLAIFLASFALLAYFPHCLAHYIVGLKFSHYVFGSSPLKRVNFPIIKKLDSLLPRLGIRLTRESRRNASPMQRLLMFSSGVLASTLLPLSPTVLAYSTVTPPLNALLPVLWVAYLLFGAYFSPKYGDLSHIRTKPPQ